MSSDTDAPLSGIGSAVVASVEDQMSVEVPSTPLAVPVDLIPASQETLPSTDGPGSPMDQDDSFQTEANDDADAADLPRVIPSSQSPPPSSQVQQHLQQQAQPTQSQQSQQSQQQQSQKLPSSQLQLPPARATASYVNSQRSAILSPPVTGRDLTSRRELLSATEFVAPTTSQINDASAEELRSMLAASLAEHTRLKMETAHHKLNYNLLSMQADEDAKRAAVENDMTRREVEALRLAESARKARHELGAAAEVSQAKYAQLKSWYDETVVENESLQKRVKLAKRVIQQKEEEVSGLQDEKELLLNRLRENREHFHLLTSPGGMFHGAMTPKQQSTPSHTRSMSYQTPRTARGGGRLAKDNRSLLDRDQGAEPIAALLQALSQENNSAPSTPITGHRPPARHVGKHVRNVQSMSSLPTTPTSKPRGEYAGLLPSVDLVPQTEPPPLRFNGSMGSASFGSRSTQSISGRYFPETPTRVRHRLPGHAGQERGRKSRESTISAEEDNAENNGSNKDIARQALQSVAARASQASFSGIPPHSLPSSQRSRDTDGRADEEVFESQASQAASAMLRRDPRESFEVAGSVDNSRDGTPAPAEKSAKLQAKLFGGVSKGGLASSDKRKFSGGNSAGSSMGMGGVDGAEDLQGSPTKKARVVPSLRDNNERHHPHNYQQQQQQQRVGLGIRYD